MPFQKPLDVQTGAFADTGQPTVNVGNVGGALNIQGGGEKLFEEFGSIATGVVNEYLIVPPPSGIVYYGLGIYLRNLGKNVTTDIPLKCEIFNFGDNAPTTLMYAGIMNAGGGLNMGAIGHPTYTTGVVPIGTRYPIKIELSQVSVGGTYDYQLSVFGLSYADTRPRDFALWDAPFGGPSLNLDDAGAGRFGHIAPSFETRDFLLSAGSVGGGRWQTEVMDEFGVWAISQSRAHNSWPTGQSGANTMPANVNSIMTIPGNGHFHRVLTLDAAPGAFIRLSHLGMR